MDKIATVSNSKTSLSSAQHQTPDALALQGTAAPDLPGMDRLLWHGAPDGFVTFAVKGAGGFRELVAVPVKALRADDQPWLPYLLPKLERDAYAGINPTYRTGVRTRTREVYKPAVIDGQHVEALTPQTSRSFIKPGTGGLRWPHRRSEDVRWLTACYVDVDGRSAETITDGPGSVANLLRAVHAELVPPPSFIIASGRGAWGFWQLVDERNPAEGVKRIGRAWHQPDTSCRASRYALSLHHAVNVALAARLQPIGADHATDAARLVRVLGSLNSASDTRVDVLPMLDSSGLMRAYTLSELAAWLHVPLMRGRPPKALQTTLQPVTEAQQQQRVAASRARCRKVYDALTQLAALRGGGFAEGHRNLGVFYLALHGQLAGLERGTVEAAAQQIASRCAGYGRDDFHAAQVRSLLQDAHRKAGRRRIPPAYATLVAALGITADEQTQIGLTARQQPRTRAATYQARHAAIAAIRARLGYTGTEAPSTRTMAQLVTEAGFPISHVSVARDYGRMGLIATGRRGRPQGQSSLPV